jgi:hypothetical protein
MPARDRYHDQVRNALVKDGWVITEAPFVDLFSEPIGQLLLENRRLRLLVVDPETQVIRQWTP